MGIGMPKFVTDGCVKVKEKYYGIKAGYIAVKEAFKLAITAMKLATSLNEKDSSPTPESILDAINTSGADIPESYKSLLKILPKDTVSKLMNVLYESLTKIKRPGEEDNDDETSPPTPQQEGEQPPGHTDIPKLDFSNQKGVMDAIGRMADVITERYRSSQATQFRPKEYAKEDDPSQNNIQTGYSEMKSDDERDFRNETVSNDNENERKEEGAPFGMRDSINYQNVKPPTFAARNTSTLNTESPFAAGPSSSDSTDTSSIVSPNLSPSDSEDSPSFTSQDSGYHPSQTGDESEDPQPERQNELPPLTKQLAEELHRRYGPKWKERLPKHFESYSENAETIPDLGLGLGPDGNRTMMMTMSKVLKDLM